MVIGVFAGDLGLDDGVPRSVYTLDTTKMTTLDTAELGVGQTLVLPNGAGSVTFVGFDQWATFQISRDPGKGVVLVAVAVMVLGLVLSLRVRRRRLWVRARAQPTADQLTLGVRWSRSAGSPEPMRAVASTTSSPGWWPTCSSNVRRSPTGRQLQEG